MLLKSKGFRGSINYTLKPTVLERHHKDGFQVKEMDNKVLPAPSNDALCSL